MVNDNEPQCDFLQTYSGNRFYPLKPRVEDVNPHDIAHSLSMQCRYAGHCIKFYSVAEHACHLFDYAQSRSLGNVISWWALHHDDSEAYVNDLIKPVKNALPFYKAIEGDVMDVICQHYEMTYDMPPTVKELDNRIIEDERINMVHADWDGERPKPLGIKLQCWSPDRAKEEYLKRVYIAKDKIPLVA